MFGIVVISNLKKITLKIGGIMDQNKSPIIVIVLCIVCLVGTEAFTLERSKREYNDGYGNNENYNEKRESEVYEKGEQVNITCPDDHIILIKDAGYGSKEIKCGDPRSLMKVEHVCDTETNCTFLVNDIFFNETDCSGEVDQEFEIEYECFSMYEEDGTNDLNYDIKYPENDGVFQKGEQVNISCSDNYVIFIKDADYGSEDIQCGDNHALMKIKHVCDSVKNCTFLVNDIFFDETDCSGEFESRLDMKYQCLPDMSDIETVKNELFSQEEDINNGDESQIGGVKDDFGNLEEDTGGVNNFGGQGEDIGGMKDEFGNPEEGHDGVHDDFDNHMHEEEIGEVNDDSGNPENGIGGVHDDFGNLEENIGGVHDDFDNHMHEEEIGGVHDDFGNMEDNIGGVNDEFGSLEDSSGGVHDDFGNPEEGIGGVHDDFGNHEEDSGIDGMNNGNSVEENVVGEANDH